jgi:NADP-dependent 3-hydroxy acid dehydrogenase YdfG
VIECGDFLFGWLISEPGMNEMFAGKVAVVAGASSGFGAAAVRKLLAKGMQVVMVARRGDRIQALAEELGEGALPFVADVTDAERIRELFFMVRERFGGLDLLFNNAGLGIPGSFQESRPEDWQVMLDINVMGVLRCTQAALPLMEGRAGAMICSVSSVGGRYGYPGWSIYCATKFAVLGFHDALRKEVGEKGIRVSLIEPGAAWTEFGETGVSSEQISALNARRQSLGALHAEDVANALLYAFGQPENVLVEEILVRPVRQIVP